MSKAFALAGGRLGYLAAAPEICDAVRVVRLPYHLSAVTQATALAALRHAEELLGRVDDLRAERDELVVWLTEQGLEVAESDANFVLFGRYADRHAVWQGLLDRGVLIRETGPDGWLRVSVGTPAEMAAFRDALTDVGAAVMEETR
jgi:histidinol-phosphate aminotransferase